MVGLTALLMSGSNSTSLVVNRVRITGIPDANNRQIRPQPNCADNDQPSTSGCDTSSISGNSSASRLWSRARIPFSTR